MRLKQITKRQARKEWAEGKTIYLQPCKMRVSWQFVPMAANLSEYQENAAWYGPDGAYPNTELWKGNIETTAWDLMYNNWHYYNTNYEMGYYAHYYIEVKK